MHKANCHAEWPLDAAMLGASPNEEGQGMMERVSSDDALRQMCRQQRLSVEIAVEWAHLGGD